MLIFVLLSFIALNNGASIVRDTQSNLANKREDIVDDNAEITLPKSIQRLGKLGINFDLDVNSTENDKQNKPYINCMEYNFNTCQNEDPADCYVIKQCYQGTPTHLLGCMAVLVYNTLENGSHPDELQHQHPHVMGCWSQDEREMAECQSETECIVDMRRTGSIERTAKFCCCRTHNCNSKFTYRNVGIHEPDEAEGTTTTVSPQIDEPEGWLLHIDNLALILFPLICIAITYFLVACLRRKFIKQRIKQIQPASKGTEEPLIQKVDEITLGDGSKIEFKDIELLNEISNGRFGQVHRAKLGESILAVKIFPANEKDSWVAEMGIYDAVHKAAFGNDSIAEFIGGFQRDENYWILTTFYEKLSLFDFLKANIVTLSEAVRMISTMLDGLAFLHEEIPSTIGNETKPIIVHRDLKSKNILVKDDLRTCITDFGLALKCDTRGVPTDQNHGQVGTRRYMSPEVLEGATEFSSFAFQQIDVYAAALVIWEIISRTALTEGEEIADYMLPYEKEVGSNPTPNQMRELVATQKYRPQVRMALIQNEISAAIVRTMSEMWDQEPDGRITSSCARDRSRQWLNEVSMSSIGTSSTTPVGP